MSGAIRSLRFILLGGLIGGTVMVLALPERTVVPESPQRADETEQHPRESLQERVRSLEDDVERLRQAMLTRSVLARDPAAKEDPSDPALVRQVADPRQRLGTATGGSGTEEATRVLGMLERLRPWGSGDSKGVDDGSEIVRARARIPLRIRFLERGATDERAREQLAGLVRDLLATGQRARACVELDRLGPTIDIAPWRLDVLRIAAMVPGAEMLEIASRVETSAADSQIKAWAMRMMGDSLATMGQRGKAIRTFAELVTRFRTCTGAQRHVSWARDRRDLLVNRR